MSTAAPLPPSDNTAPLPPSVNTAPLPSSGTPAPVRPAEPAGPMVEIEGVTKRFGTTVAVADAALSLPKGDFLTILGPSGCGKTTLLRMIAGFERPDAGRIAIHGRDQAAVPAHKRSIGMVFQRLALFPHMSAADNVAYPLRRRGWDKAAIAPRVAEMLSLVRLDGLGHRRPHELSGGQQQRVAIARALAFKPDLLLLDEPLSALDRKLREDMQLEFRHIQKTLGVTAINVTHDQREALVMSDRVVVMDAGRIEQAGPPADVYSAPATRFVAGFLGVTTLFPAVVESADGTALTVRAGGVTLAARSPGALVPGGAVECAVRAERVRLGEGENTLAGRVVERIFEGDRVVLAVDVPALGTQFAVFTTPEAAPESDDVTLGFSAADLYAFPADSE